MAEGLGGAALLGAGYQYGGAALKGYTSSSTPYNIKKQRILTKPEKAMRNTKLVLSNDIAGGRKNLGKIGKWVKNNKLGLGVGTALGIAGYDIARRGYNEITKNTITGRARSLENNIQKKYNAYQKNKNKK